MTGPRPKYAAVEALERARKLIGRGTYKYGALDADADRLVFDCASFAIRYAYGIDGHRPGFNRGWSVDWCTGSTPTCVDDVNSNAAIEDAFHVRELFEVVVGQPMPGDILAYPTIRLEGHPDPWIGHAAIVSGVERARGHWDPGRPDLALLDMIECHGPDKTSPAIREAPATVFARRGVDWPKPQHRAWLLRVRA